MQVETKDIPKAVKEAVHQVDPTATVILYGSRARGDARPDSDWDFMVLHNNAIGQEEEVACRRRVFREVELKLDTVVSLIHRHKEQVHSELYQAMPLQQNISREGIQV